MLDGRGYGRIRRTEMKCLRGLLTLRTSVTVHVVAAEMMVEQTHLMPDLIDKDQQHNGIARNRSPGSAVADDDAIRERDINYLVVRHTQDSQLLGTVLGAALLVEPSERCRGQTLLRREPFVRRAATPSDARHRELGDHKHRSDHVSIDADHLERHGSIFARIPRYDLSETRKICAGEHGSIWIASGTFSDAVLDSSVEPERGKHAPGSGRLFNAATASRSCLASAWFPRGAQLVPKGIAPCAPALSLLYGRKLLWLAK